MNNSEKDTGPHPAEDGLVLRSSWHSERENEDRTITFAHTCTHKPHQTPHTHTHTQSLLSGRSTFVSCVLSVAAGGAR